MIYVTSDLHGYDLNLFLDYLNRAGVDGEKDRLIVLGDVIDRNGDGGVSLLRWMMRKPFVTLLRGNHEDTLLTVQDMFRNAEGGKLGELNRMQAAAFVNWVNDYGPNTFLALKELAEKDPDELGKVLDYVSRAPVYLEIAAGGRDYVLVHSGILNFSPERPLEDYRPYELLYARPDPEARYYEDRTVIFGHSPTALYGVRDRMVVTDTWIDIDTGAGHGGRPMLLRLDDLKAFYF